MSCRDCGAHESTCPGCNRCPECCDVECFIDECPVGGCDACDLLLDSMLEMDS